MKLVEERSSKEKGYSIDDNSIGIICLDFVVRKKTEVDEDILEA